MYYFFFPTSLSCPACLPLFSWAASEAVLERLSSISVQGRITFPLREDSSWNQTVKHHRHWRCCSPFFFPSGYSFFLLFIPLFSLPLPVDSCILCSLDFFHQIKYHLHALFHPIQLQQLYYHLLISPPFMSDTTPYGPWTFRGKLQSLTTSL